MQKVYIGIYYLKILHYFFFSLAVFSLTAGIILFESFAMESLILFSICGVYSLFSVYIAFSIYRAYKKLVEPIMVIRTYVLPYIVLAFLTFGMMLSLVFIFPYLTELVYAFLFVNYYIVFLLVGGVIISRFTVVKKTFEFYSNLGLMRAKRLASRYSRIVNVKEYDVGSDPEADELLDNIWKNKDYPTPFVRALETRICEIKINNFNRSMQVLESRTQRTREESKLIEVFRAEKQNYMNKIQEIRQLKD
ncbi:MAG: hypothetical protein GTN39_00840 [Candidatus Aenigmarchaeota archaeon]|nr:hypothetical protein [Candidatus Aenigmarchaeota archaeon]